MPRVLTLCSLFALAALAPEAQPLRATDVVEWAAAVEPGDAPGTALFVATATVREGWRLYAADSPTGYPLRLTLGVLPPGISARGPLRQTPPREHTDPVLNETYTYHAGSARVAQGLALDRRAAGRHRLPARVRFTVCNDEVCLPPATADLRATLSAGG